MCMETHTYGVEKGKLVMGDQGYLVKYMCMCVVLVSLLIKTYKIKVHGPNNLDMVI